MLSITEVMPKIATAWKINSLFIKLVSRVRMEKLLPYANGDSTQVAPCGAVAYYVRWSAVDLQANGKAFQSIINWSQMTISADLHKFKIFFNVRYYFLEKQAWLLPPEKL